MAVQGCELWVIRFRLGPESRYWASQIRADASTDIHYSSGAFMCQQLCFLEMGYSSPNKDISPFESWATEGTGPGIFL